jgi:DNA integrity scanning protein DisA with diadenylate cyclase activity
MGKRGAPENMRPPRTKAEAKARGAKGGKASGVARREKKLMSQIYAEFLAEKFNVKTEHGPRFTTGEKLVNQVVKQVLIAGGPGAVSLMREIREATEGSKILEEKNIAITFDPLLAKEFGKHD